MNHLTTRLHPVLSVLLALTSIISSLAASPRPASIAVPARSTATAGITAPADGPADGPEFPDCSPTDILPFTCTNLQVFLLIDDSSSMLYSDRARQRIEGVKNALDILAKEYYLPAVDANAKDPRVKRPNIQVSLIHFSSAVRHNSGWKTIHPENIAEWTPQLEAFNADLTVKIDYNQPQVTDFRTAFQAAVELAADKPQTSECPRLVMLFTDGVPNLGYGNLEDKDGEDRKALTEYMKDLQDIIEPTFNRSNDYLFVTTFWPDDTFARFWNRVYKQRWVEITKDSDELDPRRVVYVRTEELAARMENIIGSTIGSQVYTLAPMSGNPQQYMTEIPITVEALRLTYYTINTKASFTVTGPDGKILQPDGKNVILTGANTSIQVLEILKPAAGSYQITTSATGGLVTQLLRFEKITAKLFSPMDPWLQLTNGQIGIRLFGAGGESVAITPQMSLQAALTQAGKTYDLAFTPGSDTFTTNWMPLTADKATVYACATLKDDKGVSIVLHNGPVGEIQIDPVSVQSGEAENACVPTDKDVRVPLQLINGRSQQPVSIDAPVHWLSKLSSSPDGTQLRSTIGEIDAKTGKYELRFKPKSAGSVEFAVKTGAIVDGERLTFYDRKIPLIRILPPRPLALTLGEPGKLGDPISVMLYRWFHPVCIDDGTVIVIGRHMFRPTQVQISGRYVDTSNNVGEPGVNRFAAQLGSPNGGKPSEKLRWAGPETGDKFSTLEFLSPGLGLYNVIVTPEVKDPECSELDSLPTQKILLINDFWEYLIILMLILVLTLLVLYLLRRYRNRHYGHEIPLILSAIVLIALNIILVNLLVKHTFECQLNCDFLIDRTLGSDSLCENPEITLGPARFTIPIINYPFKIGPFRIPAPLPPLNIIDGPLQDIRLFIARAIIAFFALASLVLAFIASKIKGFVDLLRTPAGRRAFLTYLGLWLFFFVIFCSLFYFRVVAPKN